MKNKDAVLTSSNIFELECNNCKGLVNRCFECGAKIGYGICLDCARDKGLDCGSDTQLKDKCKKLAEQIGETTDLEDWVFSRISELTVTNNWLRDEIYGDSVSEDEIDFKIKTMILEFRDKFGKISGSDIEKFLGSFGLSGDEKKKYEKGE